MKQLITGTSDQAKRKYEALAGLAPIKKIAVFFDNRNFLITDFEPEQEDVNLILQNIDGHVHETMR